MMFFQKNCLNCGKIFDILATDPDAYDILFCCEECKETYYENQIIKKAKEIGIDVPIESRFDILDL